MYEDDEREKKGSGAGLTWWVRYAIVPIAVALIAGLSGVRAAELLQPIPVSPLPATEIIPATPPTREIPVTAAPGTQPPIPIATDTPTVIPTATPTVAPVETEAPAPPVSILGRHTVHQGEYLYCIARGYGVPPQAIARANQLENPARLRAGQVLVIPDQAWRTIPSGAVCAAQFASPYARAVVNVSPARPARPATSEIDETATPDPVEIGAPAEEPIETLPPEQSPVETYSPYPAPAVTDSPEQR